MEIDADKLIANAIREGLSKAVQERICGYQSPLNPTVDAVLNAKRDEFTALLRESLEDCLGDKSFRKTIADAVRTKLARTLIDRFGGELEKRVNELKSDPSTRARITCAIEDIVKSTTT
jgi:hypothetical protein